MKNFSWHTAEYAHRPKNSDWFWTVGIITGALVIISFIFGNALFGLVLAIGVFTMTMFASRPPNMIDVEVSEKGIKIDKILYPFHSLESFSLDENHHHGPRVILKSKKIAVPLISVPVVSDHHDELRAFLASHIKEETFDEGFFHIIFDRLGF